MMEQAVLFRAYGEMLPGILHPGEIEADAGVLVIVGGPQYRVGSHRQFLLLARDLAAHGIPVFRFDYRGMGDADGVQRDFEQVRDDIAAALDVFCERTGLRRVVLWGLCDAASAALLHAGDDPRVTGLVLLNPWVRTEEGEAKAYLKHYYLRRAVSRDFWSGLLRGRLDPVASLRSLIELSATVLGRRRGDGVTPAFGTSGQPLPLRMAAGWCCFDGPILVILSGNDLTAAEFRDVARNAPDWRGLLEEPRVTLRELPEANHTFSRREWRDQVARWTREWVRAL